MTTVQYLDNQANISQDGPYGFYFIKLARGVTPKELSGAYTTVTNAEKAIEEHLNSKKKD